MALPSAPRSGTQQASGLGAARGTEDREGSATPPGPARSCPQPREERHLCRRASRGPEARHGRGRGEEAASIRTLSGLTQSPCAAETAEAAHGGVGLPAGAQDGQRAPRVPRWYQGCIWNRHGAAATSLCTQTNVILSSTRVKEEFLAGQSHRHQLHLASPSGCLLQVWFLF